MKYAYVYVLDTLADWELGHVIAELNSGQYFKRRGERIPVKTVGLTNDPVTTKGGMIIFPEMTVNDIKPEKSAILLLPGADCWTDPKHLPIIEKTMELLDRGCIVAAICGATAALAEAGILDQRPHTSNSPEYLTMFCPSYKGALFYKNEKLVDDGQLITVGSAGGLLMAYQVMLRLDVISKDALDAWYQYYLTGEAGHFYSLMDALSSI